MDAVFPLSRQVLEVIQQGEIGEVLRVVADLSEGNDLEEWWHVRKARKLTKDLAGGALLEGKPHQPPASPHHKTAGISARGLTRF